MAQKKKGSAGSVILGAAVLLLVAIGLFSSVRAGIGAVKRLSGDTKLIEEYEKLLSPVIMNDPSAFDDISRADNEQLLSIAIWSLLESELTPDDYEYVDEGMLVPKADVEKSFVRLFGTDVSPKHGTVDGGEGIAFTYDETREGYIIPITGATPIYTPDIVKLDKKGTTLVLTVGYLSSTEWTQSADGGLVPPTPSKYMRVSLRENPEGSYYISALQSVTGVDYVTEAESSSQAETEATTAKTSEAKK